MYIIKDRQRLKFQLQMPQNRTNNEKEKHLSYVYNL